MSAFSDLDGLIESIWQRAKGRNRIIIAIAGPPGAGKSTLSDRLLAVFAESHGEDVLAVMPMDGYHFDNAILDARGQRDRKGAPYTFDVDGYAAMLERVRKGHGDDIAVPVFDREHDLSRGSAHIIKAQTRIVVTEGNYLLLDEDPWRHLRPLFDLSVFLSVPQNELERRLIERWLHHGHSHEDARGRALLNDIPNAEHVLERSNAADVVITNP